VLSMKQIEAIKEMQNKGSGPCEIAEKLSVDRKTVGKYMKREDFTPQLSIQKEYPSKLDRWKETIDAWLEEDRKMRFKQRHTAKRIHQRLLEEYGDTYDCSYPLVQRYCKKVKEDRKNSTKGNLELVWHPGEAQVDFGEADCYENGIMRTVKYLCVSFPHSNGAYTQLFGGETAECVTQGLQDIFKQIGGVPRRIVFDNASGVGRRIGEKIRLAELFLRFKCHYGFEVTICNPYSGHEKGHVENKVGYIRRNLLVPAPSYDDIELYNSEFLGRCEKDWNREHYKKQITIAELFEEDRAALSPLPIKPFNCVRYEKVKTDGYGKFCLDGKHWYSSAPEMSNGNVIAAIGAHYVEVLDSSGDSIIRHRRMYGNSRTDSVDWSTSASRLFKNPGAWKNSGIRESMPEALRNNMDRMDGADLKKALKVLRDLSGQYDFETAIQSMAEAVDRGTMDKYSTSAIAARILNTGLDIIPETGPDLNCYDNELISSGRTQ
jgi:transposase